MRQEKRAPPLFASGPSSALQARVKEQPGWLHFPNALAMSGGVPLFYKGECVGGVGVSGVAEDDEILAQAVAVALDTDARRVLI